MGMFDTFISKDGSVEVQLKAGPCLLNTYREGDLVDDLSDAVYIAPDGFVVVRNGVVELVTESKEDIDVGSLPIRSKWGGTLESLGDDLEKVNPFVQAMKEIEKKYENKNGEDE